MDIRNYIRPILVGLVGLGLTVLVIVLLVKAFSGNGTTVVNQADLGKYANTAATVTLLADAPTNIDQDHRQVKITISQTQNEIDVLQGYQGTVLTTRSYANNSAAYGAFLQSLKLLNFAKGNNTTATSDYRGYCPTGDRYAFTFNDGSRDLFSSWTTSCNGQGTYKGNRAATLRLFRAQFPEQDFDQLTGQTTLGF